MNVLIVGAGAMGQWFGRAVTDDDIAVTFADLEEDRARAAAGAVGGSVDRRTDLSEPPAEAPGYDAVCLAVPLTTIEEAIATHANRADRAILDVSGVMAGPLEAMATHAPDLERVSLHPLFAPERAPGSIAAVSAASGPVTDRLLEALTASGNTILETTAAEHDRAMSSVQAATHAAVLAFALSAEPVPDGFETPIYDELSTLAAYVTGGTPRVYRDIQETFDGADDVAAAARAVAVAEGEEFDALYERAAEQWAAADEELTGQSENTTIHSGDDE